MEFTLEKLYQVWTDATGESIEVGNDADGLNLVEVRQKDDKDKVIARLTMMPLQAKLVADAIYAYCKDVEKKE